MKRFDRPFTHSLLALAVLSLALVPLQAQGPSQVQAVPSGGISALPLLTAMETGPPACAAADPARDGLIETVFEIPDEDPGGGGETCCVTCGGVTACSMCAVRTPCGHCYTSACAP